MIHSRSSIKWMWIRRPEIGIHCPFLGSLMRKRIALMVGGLAPCPHGRRPRNLGTLLAPLDVGRVQSGPTGDDDEEDIEVVRALRVQGRRHDIQRFGGDDGHGGLRKPRALHDRRLGNQHVSSMPVRNLLQQNHESMCSAQKVRLQYLTLAGASSRERSNRTCQHKAVDPDALPYGSSPTFTAD